MLEWFKSMFEARHHVLCCASCLLAVVAHHAHFLKHIIVSFGQLAHCNHLRTSVPATSRTQLPRLSPLPLPARFVISNVFRPNFASCSAPLFCVGEWRIFHLTFTFKSIPSSLLTSYTIQSAVLLVCVLPLHIPRDIHNHTSKQSFDTRATKQIRRTTLPKPTQSHYRPSYITDTICILRIRMSIKPTCLIVLLFLLASNF